MSSTYSVKIPCVPGIDADIYFNSMCGNCGVNASWFNEPSNINGFKKWTIKACYSEAYEQKRKMVKEYFIGQLRVNSDILSISY